MNTIALPAGYNNIKSGHSFSNLNYWYGPYYIGDTLENDGYYHNGKSWFSTLEELEDYLLSNDVVDIGFTVGILDQYDNIQEYWFQKKSRDSLELELRPKVDDFRLDIEYFRVAPSETDENKISFTIKVNGKGFKVKTEIYLGQKLIVPAFSTNLGFEQTVEVVGPEDPNTYVFTAVVTDPVLGQNTSCDSLPFQWKEIDIKVTKNPFAGVIIKSANNINNLPDKVIKFKINKIDEVRVNSVSINNHNLQLTSNLSFEYTLTDNLNPGSQVIIHVDATLNGENKSKNYVLVTLTQPDVYTFLNPIVPETIYAGKNFTVAYYFEAENDQTYDFYISYDSEEDPQQVSMTAYKWNNISLYIPTQGSYTLEVSKNGTILSSYNIQVQELTYEVQEGAIDISSIITNIQAKSFIFELKCNVPYSISENELFSFANIKIYPTYILFDEVNPIKYPVFQGQDITLGFMYNVKSSIGNSDYIYNALFINGCLCAKYPINTPSNLTLRSPEVNEITILNNRLYYNASEYISQDPQNFLLEGNYRYDNNDMTRNTRIPTLSLTTLSDVTLPGKYIKGEFGQLNNGKYDDQTLLSDILSVFPDIPIDIKDIRGERDDWLKEKIKKTLKNSADPKYNDLVTQLNKYTILFKQTRDSKPYLQKNIVVPCEYTYKDEDNNETSGYLLATTQGTSTLGYALPNFTFTFFSSSQFDSEVEVSIIPKINRTFSKVEDKWEFTQTKVEGEYYTDSELVAKADYMESSHLNNTPTAMLYNALTTKNGGFAIDSNTTILDLGTLTEANKLNAIEGIPIVLEVDNINYGSFMLNIGKESSNIGFGSNGISLEGTSNEADGGFSSAFDFASKDTAVRNLILNSDIDNLTEIDPKISQFLNEGLEYRYSNAEADRIGDDVSECKRILKMWKWVYEHDDNNPYTLEQFKEVFNFDLCALYFIQMMIFGQTDNLRKNCMFDQFEQNGKWCVRPYDMDSQAGLDNGGLDTYPPYIEINKEFILNPPIYGKYSKEKISTNALLEGAVSTYDVNPVTHIQYTEEEAIEYNATLARSLGKPSGEPDDSDMPIILNASRCYRSSDNVVNYLGTSVSRFPFTSANSNLWFRFYKNLKSDIQTFYKNLRTIGYSADTVITVCKKSVYDQLDITQYNLDFKNKYLSMTDPTSNQFAAGNRWLRYKDWIQKRFDFCDVYFEYKKYESFNYNLNNFPLQIEYSMPLYTITRYGDTSSVNTYYFWNDIYENPNNTGIGTSGGTKNQIWFAPEYITNDHGLFSMATYNFSPKVKLNYLTTFNGSYDSLSGLDLSENILMQEMTIKGLSGYRYEVSQENEVSEDKNIPRSTQKLTLNECNLNGDVHLHNYSHLEELYLMKFDTKGRKLILSQCPNLKKLVISESIISELEIEQCGSERVKIDISISESTISSVNISESYISFLDLSNQSLSKLEFNGSANSVITSLCLYNTIINSKVLNIEKLTCSNLILNQISEVQVTFTSQKAFNCLSVQGAKITQFGNTAKTFDGSSITNNVIAIDISDSNFTTIINQIRNDNITSYTLFRLYGCEKIEKVVNLQYNAFKSDNKVYSVSFFRECKSLKEISNCTLTISPNYAFANCYNLTTLTNNTFTIKGYKDDATLSNDQKCNATRMFFSCQKLSWQQITDILGSFRPVVCTEMFYKKGWSQDETIDLSYFQYAKNMVRCFCIYDFDSMSSTIPNRNISNNVTITFTGTLDSATDLRSTFAIGFTNYLYNIPTDIIAGNQTVTDMTYCFMGHRRVGLILPTLPSQVTILTRMCYNSDVKIPTNWKVPASAVECGGMFMSARLTGETSVDISELFTNCTSLTNLTNCFRTCNNYECNQQISMPNNSNTVNIAGIFAQSSEKNITIPFGFGFNWMSDMEATNYLYDAISVNSNDSFRWGPYYNVKVQLSNNNISLTSQKLQGIFDTTKIDSSGNVTLTVNAPEDLNTNVRGTCDCYRLCRQTAFTNNQLSLSVILKNVYRGEETFRKCTCLTSVSASDSKTSLNNAISMFQGSNITAVLDLYNFTNLEKADRMYSGCTFISGKFEDLKGANNYLLNNTIKSITGMFASCINIYGGVPSSFIEAENTIYDISELFANTYVLASNSTVEESLNISTLFPNVTKVNKLFYNSDGRKTDYTYQQSISTSCFSNCTDCRSLFNSALISLPASMDFSSALSMQLAYANNRQNNSSLDRNLSTLSINASANINGLFATGTGTVVNKVAEVDNSTFKETVKEWPNSQKQGALLGYQGDDSTNIVYQTITIDTSDSLHIYSAETYLNNYK